MSTGGQDYETLDVRPRRVLVTAGVVVAVLLLVLLAVRGLNAWLAPPELAARRNVHSQPPIPHLQAHPQADLEALHVQKHRVLDSYGWVDRQAGLVHIPIERAMSLLLEHRQQQDKNR
jgi:hypothetical protein